MFRNSFGNNLYVKGLIDANFTFLRTSTCLLALIQLLLQRSNPRRTSLVKLLQSTILHEEVAFVRGFFAKCFAEALAILALAFELPFYGNISINGLDVNSNAFQVLLLDTRQRLELLLDLLAYRAMKVVIL